MEMRAASWDHTDAEKAVKTAMGQMQTEIEHYTIYENRTGGGSTMRDTTSLAEVGRRLAACFRARRHASPRSNMDGRVVGRASSGMPHRNEVTGRMHKWGWWAEGDAGTT